MDQISYSEYMDDLNYSQGFYITPHGPVFVGGIRPVQEYSDVYRKAKRAAVSAVEEHNKGGKEPSLEFLKIVNLNMEPAAGAIYYITMVAADSSGETRHYEAKVWEKLNTGYQLQIFRRAPYSIKSSEKVANKICCVGINNLLPWMDESYIYYKCFYRSTKELLGVEVIQNSKGVLWFRNRAESEMVLKKYVGKIMPRSNISYDFDLSNCPTKPHF